LDPKKWTRVLPTLICLLFSWPACAQAPVDDERPSDPGQQRGDGMKDPPGDKVVVKGRRWLFNRETRFAHSLPEVDGATITVTKKTSVVNLADQPSVIDNNQREIFDRLPGIVLAEQQNPTQLNLTYRGLGNPQESEFILGLQDGIPLELDWIGYPTLYYLPVPQTLSSVQMIRGGSGLMYGPEPQPVINYISRAPVADRPLGGATEQIGGSDALFSSFNSISGAPGDWNYLADYSHRQSRGQRLNGQYTVNAGDLTLGLRFGDRQKVALAIHAYSVDSGLAGLMSGAQFHLDPDLTTTPADRLWTDRDSFVLTYENHFSDHDFYIQKLWSGYSDLVTRTNASATLAQQRFHYTGLDGRCLHSWGRGNALTVGYTAYTSRSPYNEFTSTNPFVDRDDESGKRLYADDRKTRYGAIFAENVFRLRYFHLVTSARFDRQELVSHETAAPPSHPLLVDRTYSKNVPLFGLGIGNDFGRGNETYLNVSQGFRPLRYLDISSPFSNFAPGNNPNPTKYVTYELGVHGWPSVGLYYDVSLFQVNVKDRIEARQLNQSETIDVNTGNTRSRGAELEGSYDVLRLWADVTADRHLTVFANASLLNARFTSSAIKDQTGKTPAYAPDYVLKAGTTLRREAHYKVSLVVDLVTAQFFQDSNQPIATTPARIPGYTVADLSGEYSIARGLSLMAGISNLTDRRYYSRVFLSRGQLEPARSRTLYAGVAYEF
jgi:Fe(3+) dicitrate transport protein